MPKKSTKRPISKTKKKSVTKVQIGSPWRKWIGLFVIIGVIGLGVYTLLNSFALNDNASPVAEEHAASALGLVHAPQCGDGYVAPDPESQVPLDKMPCTHPDLLPEGTTMADRAKKAETIVEDVAKSEKEHPSVPSDAPPEASAEQQTDTGPTTANNTGTGDMTFSGRSWPCLGTGTDGYRVQLIYVYKSGYSSRLSTLRPTYETIAKRMNAVVYNSAYNSGDKIAVSGTNPHTAMQIRFATSSTCVLSIIPVALTGDITMDMINNVPGFTRIRNQLVAKGYNLSSRKYVVWVDYSASQSFACGQGLVWNNENPDPTLNPNNKGGAYEYSMIWKECWNYGEPHEFMHNLGGVQSKAVTSTGTVIQYGAPHATKYNHCYDQNDIMCYNDGSGISMRAVCTSSAAIWHYDCGFNDYFDAYAPSGYLATHWNTAKSYFLMN